MRRAASLLCLVGALLGTLGLLPARAQSGGPVVEVFEASGVLDDSVLGALRRDLDGAEERGARVFLVQLSSFGGLGVDPAEVQRTVAEAGVPVAVWVGPRSAEAAGTAAFLLAGADVVGVARDARVGPALPAELGRGRDPGAEAALLAESGLPAAAGRSRISGAAAEAAGLADYQAESLPDAVRRLDGQQVDDRPLEVTGFQVRFLSRSLVDRVRHGLANPTLAYLLLLAAAAGLTLAGSWWLFATPSPLLRVDGRLAVLGVLWSLAWFVVILTVILRSQRQAPMGTEALVGSRGVVRSMLNPGGIVVVDGAMWRGRAGAGGRAPGSVQGTPAPAVPRLPTAAWCSSSWSPGCCSAASAGG